jgi:hypothetical protein
MLLPDVGATALTASGLPPAVAVLDQFQLAELEAGAGDAASRPRG